MDFYLTTSASTFPCFQITWNSWAARVVGLQCTFPGADKNIGYTKSPTSRLLPQHFLGGAGTVLIDLQQEKRQEKCNAIYLQ